MPGTEEPWTVRRLLEWTTAFFKRREVDSPRLSAELLLAHVLESPRIKLYTGYERELSVPHLDLFRALVKRAGEQEPVAYLTGKAHFFNLELRVTPDVLIPRPDTEVLVENAIRIVRSEAGMETPRMVDLCTGSGCVALALASNLPGANIVATEISLEAAAVARENAARLKLADRVVVAEGDLLAPLAALPDKSPYEVIVGNPPYIATGQIAALDRTVRDFEPRLALDGGEDGLDAHRRILGSAGEWLVPRGFILLEIAFDQSKSATQMMEAFSGFSDVKILKDYAGNPRVLAARRV